MRSRTRWVVAGSTLLLVLLCGAVAQAKDTKIRWDIISLQLPSIKAGGVASALTEDGFNITLTGTGTFKVKNPTFTAAAAGLAEGEAAAPWENANQFDARPVDQFDEADDQDEAEIGPQGLRPLSHKDVDGGGDWKITDKDGKTVASGTYKVTELISFTGAPGTAPPPVTDDTIGKKEDSHGGLAVLRIEYSDKSTGILTVGCHIVGTPDSVFEGITATKGYQGFWNHGAPKAGVDANRTNFHVVPKK